MTRKKKFRQAAHRGAKDRRVTRSASSVKDHCRARDRNKKKAPVQTRKETEPRRKSEDPDAARNAMQQGHRDCKCLQVAVWRLRHWRASVPWSIPAELLKILVSSSGGANKPHKLGIGHKPTREGSQYRPSPIFNLFFVSLFAVVRAVAYAPIAWHRAQGAFIPEGATAERCILVMCPFGRSWYGDLWEKNERKKQGTRPDQSKRLLGTLGPRMPGGAKKRGSNPGAAKMSTERRGRNDFGLEAA